MTGVTPAWMLTTQPYVLGIVGSEASKFTAETEAWARQLIRSLLMRPGITAMASGHCHLGGIDIWAEEIAAELKLTQFIFPPKDLTWAGGYKPRNLQIVNASHEVHCITIRDYPPDYDGMRFKYCYHCQTSDHVKSGGCWTALQAKRKGKIAQWHIV
jgi:hypothetical protein